MTRTEASRRYRELHPEDREKRLKYAQWYYQNVTKPKRQADGSGCA